jgi:hypothetical protein
VRYRTDRRAWKVHGQYSLTSFGNFMSQEPFFHQPSGTVRFWVLVDDVLVGAMIGKATLHYRYHPNRSDDDPLETYLANAAEIDEAVRRRVATGSSEPVMLRDPDIRAPPRV